MTRLVDGRAIAAVIAGRTAGAVAGLRAAGTVPGLAVLLPTGDPGAAWYVRAIERAGRRRAGRGRLNFSSFQAAGHSGSRSPVTLPAAGFAAGRAGILVRRS